MSQRIPNFPHQDEHLDEYDESGQIDELDKYKEESGQEELEYDEEEY